MNNRGSMTDEEVGREIKELRILYYAMKEELAVLKEAVKGELKSTREAMQVLRAAQDRTNKILMGIATMVGGAIIMALVNLVLK